MFKYLFTEKAEQDFENISIYTKKLWGNAQARKYMCEIQSACRNIASNPNIGINAEKLGKNVKMFPKNKHNIFYVKRNNDIVIVRILHGSQDFINIL